MQFTFDVSTFRAMFPQFATTPVDAVLQMYWTQGNCYVSNFSEQGCYDFNFLYPDCRLLALNLITAHLAVIGANAAMGKTTDIVQSSTVDKISVTLALPPLPDQWQWWLNSTPYGRQLLALFQVSAVGGDYVGGLPELAAIRRVGGIFY